MYPKNAASPEPIAIGAVVQISDGAVQTSGCTVRIKPIGVAEGDGAGTTAYSTDGIVLYTPTQAETNYTSFILIAKKTSCLPTSITIITTSSSTPGTVLLAPTTHTSAVVPTVTTATNVTTVNGLAANVITAASIAADAITDAKVASDVTIASVTGAVGSVTGAVGSVTGNVGGNVVGTVASVVGAVGSVTGAVGSVTGAVGSVASGGITRASFAAETGWQSVRSNTAQAGASTTITLDASASATTDYYKNALIVLTGGTGVGQARYCTAYNGTTKVATVTAWATNPDNTSTFAIIAADAIVGATAPTASQVADEVQTRTIAAVTTVNGLAANVITAASMAADASTEIVTAMGTGTFLTAIPWNASWDAEVQSECADALGALVIEGTYDLVETMKILLAAAAGKTTIVGATITFRDTGDTKDRIVATVTAAERTAVTLDVT